ncbi:hypothetical protein ACF0H5_004322 [Mactra antiquata]
MTSKMEGSQTRRRSGYVYVPRRRRYNTTEKPSENQHHSDQAKSTLLEHVAHTDEHSIHAQSHEHHSSIKNATHSVDNINGTMNSTNFHVLNDFNVTKSMINLGDHMHHNHHHPAHHGHVHNSTMHEDHMVLMDQMEHHGHVHNSTMHEDQMDHMGEMDHHGQGHHHMMGGHHEQGHHHMMGGHHGMSMGGPHFLLEGLKISSIEGIVAAMLFTMVLTAVLEFLSIYLHIRERHRKQSNIFSGNKLLFNAFTAVIHMVKLGLAYIGMLCVMTMNVWIFVSIVLGSGISYLFIRPAADALTARSLTKYSKGEAVIKEHEEEVALDTNVKASEHVADETDAFIT